MEKRVFLAIFLCFAVLAVYQAYFVPKEPPKPAVATGALPAVQSGSAAPAATTAEAASSPQVPTAAPVIADTAARDIVVETDSVTAVITTKGAALKSWKLKHYLDSQHHPLELVPQDLPETFLRPLSLATDDAKLSATLRTALFLPDASTLSLGATTGRLNFEYRDASGLTAHKTFEFQPSGRAYIVKVEASIDMGGKPQPVILEWGPAVGSGLTPEGARPFPPRAIQLRDGKVERLSVSNLSTQSRYESAVRFAGVEDQYFMAAVLPTPQVVRMDYQPITLPIPDDKENRTRAFIAYSVRVPAAAALPFYMGPKEVDAMRAVDPELTGAIDFGMFRFLVVPLLQALKWINGFAGNYGVSIILLTIFINLVIFPLRHRSMVSMRKMQSLQPEVKAIQDRFAKYKITDPERGKMNQEMMALYKQRGVNPASGCVPMLLTMPVLFAFYAMLSASIELRGTPFFGWLHDLSVKDPYYITPVLMGGTMFWQQRMMPSTADPVQQKMFMFMPLIFTTMFLAAPSGLVVYWLVSNLLAIGQQYTTNRLIGAPVRPVKVLPRGPSPGGKR